jgi:RNA polymerase sigma-70 factor (ECF subfamily)
METSASLLARLRDPSAADAWARFVRLYTPLLFSWARRLGEQEPDAADLVQDVLAGLVQSLPEFRYDPGKSFRAWLRAVFLNRWRDRRRREAAGPARAGDGDLNDWPDPADPDAAWEAEYRQRLVARALHLMRTEFAEKTWKACWEHAAVGRPAAEVAAELGIRPGSVYVAKARVLAHLRRELEGLLD